jgi:hypothetical protein
VHGPLCGFDSCSLCGGPWHEGGCNRLRDAHRDEEAASAELIVTCPQCKSSVVKKRGCNLLTCSICHAKICHFCRELIPPEVGYAHFWAVEGEVCPPNMCPLWTGETNT